MDIKIEEKCQWDADIEQTKGLTPNGSHSIVFNWQIDPHPVDAGVPIAIATVIAKTLTDLGEVFFRWAEGTPAPGGSGRLIAPQSRSTIQHIANRLTASWPVPIFATRSWSLTTELFKFEWETQGQMVLVCEESSGNAAGALAALHTRRRWNDFEFSPAIIGLMAPIVDGNGLVFSAYSQDTIRRFTELLESHIYSCGLSLTH